MKKSKREGRGGGRVRRGGGRVMEIKGARERRRKKLDVKKKWRKLTR